MANLTILQPQGKVRYVVTSNDVNTGWVTCGFWANDIVHVHDTSIYVEIHFSHGVIWDVSHNGADNTWQVDNVAGDTSIASSAELAILIEDLRG